MNKIKNLSWRSGELATTLSIGALMLIVAGLLLGANMTSHNTTSSTASAQTQYISDTSDSSVTLNNFELVTSSRWDYILKGDICFSFAPPGRSAYKVQVLAGDQIIGSSVRKNITAPAQAKCSGRGLKFSAPINLPGSNICTDLVVRLDTEGRWPSFKKEIANINSSLYCTESAATPVPRGQTQGPVLSPTREPSSESSQPAITGKVTVYSCTKPDYVAVGFCGEGTGGTNCRSPEYDKDNETTPVSHGIWLDDVEGDRTWIYKYSITRDMINNNEPIKEGSTYTLGFARGTIGDLTKRSQEDDMSALSAPGSHDYTVHARAETCGCSYQAKNFVKDEDGNYITKYDNSVPQYGTANDKQRARRGEGATAPFRSGRFDSGLLDLSDRTHPESYGPDSFASIKLYHDGADVVSQECTSTGAVPACPGKTRTWSKNSSDVRDPNIIDGVRIACGANVEYGWILRDNGNPLEFMVGGIPFDKKRADVNKDGAVNTLDYQEVAESKLYGSFAEGQPVDVNADGSANGLDLSIVVSLIGESVGK